MMSVDVLFPIVCLFAVAFVARFVEQSWVAPGALHSLFYSVIASLTLIVEDYALFAGALWWMVGSVCVFALGSFGGSRYGGIAPGGPSRGSLRLYGIEKLIVVFAALGVLYVVLVYRFSSIDRPPLVLQVLNPFLDVTPILGGLYFASDVGRYRRSLALLSLAPIVLACLIFSGRSGLVLAIGLWCAGYFPMRLLVGGRRLRFTSRGHLAAAVIASVSLVFLSLAVTTFRLIRDPAMSLGAIVDVYIEGLNWEDLRQSWELLAHGYTGGVPAFSLRFEDMWFRGSAEPTWGAIIFAGPLDLFGLIERSPMESIAVQEHILTNVYTPLQPLIDDFTLWGSLAVLALVGLVAGLAFRRVQRGRAMFIPILVVFYVNVIGGAVFFRYNSIIVSYLLVTAYLSWLVYFQARAERAAAVRRSA